MKRKIKNFKFSLSLVLVSLFVLLIFAVFSSPKAEMKQTAEDNTSEFESQRESYTESEPQSSISEQLSQEWENADSNTSKLPLFSQILDPAGSGTRSGNEIDFTQVPEYAGKPFVVLNDNIPNFSADELKNQGYESYSDLDVLARTRAALASVGIDTMPKEDEVRGSISSIRPTGWVQKTYDHISGKYLYNRCHLIGWQLSAENANEKNLITGTKYLNVNGMLPFENMVADYIKETSNHVAYRITPIYLGDDLLARGIEMEAYSIEDSGEGICFHVFCYNVQPGVTINYSDGSSSLEESTPEPIAPPTAATTAQATTVPPVTTASNQSTVLITKSGKRYHSTSTCSGLKNAKAVFESSLLDAQNKGLTPCSICY
jgi:DNA-entry nuclease